MGLAGDSVDPELTALPRRWDIRFIRRFMLQFGLLSSIFDFITFGALLLVVLDVGAWRIVSRLFDRERLLTRYGRT